MGGVLLRIGSLGSISSGFIYYKAKTCESFRRSPDFGECWRYGRWSASPFVPVDRFYAFCRVHCPQLTDLVLPPKAKSLAYPGFSVAL